MSKKTYNAAKCSGRAFHLYTRKCQKRPMYMVKRDLCIWSKETYLRDLFHLCTRKCQKRPMHMAKGRPTYIHFKQTRLVAGVGACARIIHFHLFLLILFVFFLQKDFFEKTCCRRWGARLPGLVFVLSPCGLPV